LLRAPTVHKIIQVLLFLLIVSIPLMIRRRDVVSAGADFQNMTKLAVWMACFGLSLYFIRNWGHRLLSAEKIYSLMLLLLMTLSATYAPNFAYTLGCSISLAGTLFIFIMARDAIGERSLYVTTYAALSTLIVVSLIVYFVLPDFGRLFAWENGRYVRTTRMSGIAGAPNSIGFISAFALIVFGTWWLYGERPRSKWPYILALLHVVALILSESRTSTAAMLVAFTAVFFTKVTHLRAAFLLLIGAGAALILVVVDPVLILSALSRSGDAEEITTGTGRLYIWQSVLDLIMQRPLQGWGFASSVFILPDFSTEIGHTAPHAHNAFLQIWFSVGILGPVFYVLLMLSFFINCVRSRDRLKITLFIFLFLTGLTESSFFSGAPSVSAVPLGFMLALDYKFRDRKVFNKKLFPLALHSKPKRM
jgi:exopolysaccharide production protein ExoQ